MVSPEKNPRRIVSPARAEIEHLLFQYRGEIGAGKMRRASNTLADAIGRLLDIVEPVKYSIDVGNLPVEEAKSFVEQLPLPAMGARLGDPPEGVLEKLSSPPPCAPCDVSIPNNTELIEDFKGSVVLKQSDAIETQIAPAPKTAKKVKPNP